MDAVNTSFRLHPFAATDISSEEVQVQLDDFLSQLQESRSVKGGDPAVVQLRKISKALREEQARVNLR